MDQFTTNVVERFEYLGFWLDDADGDVEEPTAQNVTVRQMSLIDVGEDYATWEGTADIDYMATISYEDPDSGIWDSEDKVWFGRETVNREIERTITIPVELHVLFEPKIPEGAVIDQVIVNQGDDIRVKFWEDKEWW